MVRKPKYIVDPEIRLPQHVTSDLVGSLALSPFTKLQEDNSYARVTWDELIADLNHECGCHQTIEELENQVDYHVAHAAVWQAIAQDAITARANAEAGHMIPLIKANRKAQEAAAQDLVDTIRGTNSGAYIDLTEDLNGPTQQSHGSGDGAQADPADAAVVAGDQPAETAAPVSYGGGSFGPPEGFDTPRHPDSEVWVDTEPDRPSE